MLDEITDVKLSFDLLDKPLALLEAEISSFKVDPLQKRSGAADAQNDYVST